MDIRCVLQEKVSEKTGKSYTVLYIPDLEKTIFLEPVEVKLIAILFTKKNCQ